jgi:hypothetical protein
MVPLWRDAGTLENLAAWKAEQVYARRRIRKKPFVASLIRNGAVKPFLHP